ncbi:MAG: hypothetical protein WAV28_07720, partial [Sedimentisphaerales bacterium]
LAVAFKRRQVSLRYAAACCGELHYNESEQVNNLTRRGIMKYLQTIIESKDLSQYQIVKGDVGKAPIKTGME